MARIRTVKPSFFHHEGLFDLEAETGLPVRLAFIGLWTCCDRDGRFAWRPRSLKSEVLPFDSCDFSRVLDALATRGFLVRYTLNGEEYGYIPSWKKHQFINHREAASILPQPVQNEHVDASGARQARVDDVTATREPREQDARATVGVREGKEYREGGRHGRVTDEGEASPGTLARAVMNDLGIHGRDLPIALEALVKSQSRLPNYDPEELRSRLVHAWKNYKHAMPKLKFAQKPENFFGGSTWDDPRCWPWKDGTGPGELTTSSEQIYLDVDTVYDYDQSSRGAA